MIATSRPYPTRCVARAAVTPAATSPRQPVMAVKTCNAVMLCPQMAVTGAEATNCPTKLIETQWLNERWPVSIQRNWVTRYDQSSLRGIPSAP